MLIATLIVAVAGLIRRGRGDRGESGAVPPAERKPLRQWVSETARRPSTVAALGAVAVAGVTVGVVVPC